MIRRIPPRLTAVAVLVAAAAFVRPAAAQPAGPARLLDVPYLSQSVALCGGAAAAMVMRYWGATDVYAESFASLVRPDEGGIRGDDLRAALIDRGWDARAFRGDAALVKQHLASRRPVVALIEDRPGTFHYVVIVGWVEDRVIAHDPARAPFQVYDEARFTSAWGRSGFFTLLALPGKTAAPGAREDAPGAATRSPCDAMVAEGVRLATDGDRVAAERVFEAAAAVCPQASAPWRERAGLRVLDKDWLAAVVLAERAVALDPKDAHAWRILATGRYLAGDTDGALAAWNEAGEPILDLVNVQGLNRTRYAIALDAAALEPREVLTAAALGRARRRLAELPSAQVARALYRPIDGGRAVIDATVVERPLLPTAPPSLIAMAVRAASQRELRATVSSPTGGGEAWTVGWRWEEHRPALRFEYSAPGGPGVVRNVAAFRIEETFASAGGPVGEKRTGASVGIADWTLHGTRWNLSAGYEQWDGDGGTGVLAAGARQLFDADRLELMSQVFARLGGRRATGLSAGAGWRSSTAHEGMVALANVGVDAVSDDAPLSLWPGAGVGAARDRLLRAHPLLDDGVVARGAFGRTLLHGGAEWRLWRTTGKGLVRLGPAVFLDVAKAARTRAPFSTRAHADIGVGLRLAVPGAGVIRVDVAHGLRDGETAWSVGWAR